MTSVALPSFTDAIAASLKATRFVRQDLALVKLCLCAAGVMLGLAAPKKLRKWAALGAVVGFVATYLPIMLKFLPHLEGEMRKE